LLLSICIPTFNRAGILAASLDALMADIGPSDDVEIVVSDNASSDGTADVVAARVGRKPSISYWRNPTNIGLLANFCAGLRRAKGRLALVRR
jgi:abequosyltransferase